MDRVRSGDAAIQFGHDARHICHRTVAACASTKSSALGWCCTRSCIEHGGLIYDEYKLAIVCARDNDELSDADAHVGLSQLFLGCSRDGAGRCTDPWHLAAGVQELLTFLVRHDPRLVVGGFAVSSWLCASARLSR